MIYIYPSGIGIKDIETGMPTLQDNIASNIRNQEMEANNNIKIIQDFQNLAIKINDNGLVALALLIAESDPGQKDLMVRLIVNLLID